MVDCSVRDSAVMHCGIEVLSGKKCHSYSRRQEVTAVAYCNFEQSAAVDCGFTVPWVLRRYSYRFRWEVTAVVDCTLN